LTTTFLDKPPSTISKPVYLDRHLKTSPPIRRSQRGFPMPTDIGIAEPKTFQRRRLMLGVPLVISALSLLLIAGSAHYDVPLASFDPQEQLAPF
jgi:hypothetical protein